MVRNYKRKMEVRWTKEDMEKAITEAKSTKNIKSSANKYSIPYTTLRDHMSGRVSGENSRGHPTVLTAEEETEIVDACIIFAEWGFGLGRKEVEGIVGNYLKCTKKKNPFKDTIPGEGWWSGFMKRHPEIRKRKPQHLQMVRAKQSNRIIVNHWFTSCLEPALQNLDLFNKPEQIYNVDESGFPLSWTPKTILTKKGQKTPQALMAGSGRENITVQTCISGSGTLLPPYVVYKGERLMSNTTFGGPLASRYAVSHNGWMTEESFVDWLKALFIPSLPPTRPVLLILDGHKSHITYEVREIARDNNIHLLKLPPHTTHLLQPLDIGVFNRMKGTCRLLSLTLPDERED